ncbi:hypothetical protein F5B22DRAFT_441200 [Xylaria bambusicola]|uniref:uncharacterized protein n=1 Tax=Xylaria bambusicola TaxID=326684 RepID=UPI00200738FD|nr:uncharacterized protein F5B22DRAFT_441200 [Xylaria bambusicola]KAI0506571.1 hypothetical protein F5B22DRAFT_441200 [Xylaria bambusicola]
MNRGANGESGPVLDPIPFPLAMGLSALIAIAVYNSVELFIFIFRTFSRRRGLYFWSAVCATTGILLIPILCLLRFFALANPGTMASLISVSWMCMVTGQSLMLYSRLHLVLCDPRKLRWLLCMIIGVFVFIEIPVGTLFAVNNFFFTGARVATAYDVMEKLQLSVFTVQECLLSGLYLYEWAGVRKELEITKGPRVRRLFHELIGLFILVLALDLSLVGLQFSNQFKIQITYKPVVYSIKLKVEIYVLNTLVALLNSNYNCQQGLPFRDQTIPLHTRAEDDPWPPQNIHSVNAAGEMARQRSENSTMCGSLSSTGSRIAKVPRIMLGA